MGQTDAEFPVQEVRFDSDMNKRYKPFGMVTNRTLEGEAFNWRHPGCGKKRGGG